MPDFLQLQELAKRIRYRILEASLRSGNAHPASSLSMVEILVSLYHGGVLETQALLRNSPSSRDCLVLSKAHGILALYALQVEMGMISEERLWKFKRPLPEGLPGEPDPSVTVSTGLATGPLGGGLALAVGRHLGALRRFSGNIPRTVAILGDGECQKGQIFEAASYAGRLKMDGLIAIIDNNGLQLDGPVEAIAMPIKDLWRASGWLTLDVDGHNVYELVQALDQATKADRPVALLAHTVKGKGVPEMENEPAWHYYRGDDADLLFFLYPKRGRLL